MKKLKSAVAHAPTSFQCLVSPWLAECFEASMMHSINFALDSVVADREQS
jgi:hypothetical protein